MTKSKPLAPAVLCVVLAAPLAACGVDRRATGSILSSDYRVNHPIVLATAPETLDVFPNGMGLDVSSASRVKEFGQHYTRFGQGQITILTPTGGRDDHYAVASLGAIRRQLVAGGVKGSVNVGSYPVSDPSLAAPVRLSFEEIKAKVPHSCGQWPADLASGSTIESWENQPYYNFGCANQAMLATQVDDPRDLANPRAETPADTEMRSRGILNVRQGKDPGTDRKTKNTEISSVGTN